MTTSNAFEAIRRAIGEDSGVELNIFEETELRGILSSEGAPDSEEDCRHLVMGREDESGASVPEELKKKHSKLHAWLDELLT